VQVSKLAVVVAAPYPLSYVTSTSVADASSFHTKSGGVSGFPGGWPAPIAIALIPLPFNSGIVARVHPGTSRCDTVVGFDRLNSTASACGSASAASKSELSGKYEASPLCGKPWMKMSPR
jgi:hypothetical protein